MTLKAFVVPLAKTLWSLVRVIGLSVKNIASLAKIHNSETILLGNGPSCKETLGLSYKPKQFNKISSHIHLCRRSSNTHQG